MTPTGADRAPCRSLSFESFSLVVELDVTAAALVGQLLPAGPGTIEVQGRCAGSAPVDERGCFVLRPVPVGSFRLLVHTDDGDVVTDAVTLG